MIIFSHKAFTLVEIMIVVIIIGLIFAIGLPTYYRIGLTSKKNVCISNLKEIDSAMTQWAIDNNVPAGLVPSDQQEEDIYAYIRRGRPTCPSRGTYSMHQVGVKPQVRCSREEEEGHKLPE